MQAVIGTQDGESHQFELNEQQANALTGKQINDEIEGSRVGLDGYTLKITGGSDQDGFPMRESIQGTGRRQILLGKDTGATDVRDGERQRKTVRGNTVADDIEQLNLKVVEQGDTPVDELLNPDDDADEDA